MDLLNAAINLVLRGLAGAFSWSPPIVSLTVISALVGIAMLWVFRKTSDQAKIRAVKRRVHACLLEMRAYSDEPSITWRTQKTLMGANLRYMGLALQPALWMGLPVAILLIHMEAFYGRAPLPLNRETVVTARLRAPVEGLPLTLTPPAGMVVSAPPVRIPEEGQVSWRIRPDTAVSGELRFQINGQSFTKRVEAGGAPRFIPGRRVDSLWSALWHPDEPRLAAGQVEWVEIPYPEAYINLFGLQMNWLIWLLIISMLSALVLKKRFGVTL